MNVLNMFDKLPIVKAKNCIPVIIQTIEKIISKLVTALMSPYPTVAKVVYVQYKLAIYSSKSVASNKPNRKTQVFGSKLLKTAVKYHKQATICVQITIVIKASASLNLEF